MRSYSFDIKFEEPKRKNPITFQLTLNTLKMNYIFLIFTILNEILFSFNQNNFSNFTNIITILYSLSLLFDINQMLIENNPEDNELSRKQSFTNKHNYLIYLLAINIADLLFTIIYNYESLYSGNNFEIYFFYTNLFLNFLTISLLFTILLSNRSFVEKIKQEIKDKYERI